MNTKLFLIAVAIVAAFSIAAVVATISPTAVAQNMTGDNATMMMAGNYTADNKTGGNWTK